MRSYCSFVKIAIQTKSRKKITFTLSKLAEHMESVNVALADTVECAVDKILACTSVNELSELIINLVDTREVTELFGYDDEIMAIIQDKTEKFSEKMQNINDLSDISYITIREEMNATGEYAIDATKWCDEKLSKEIIEQACDSSEEFEKINAILFGNELTVFNAMMETKVYLNNSKIKTNWSIDGETAYGEDGFELSGNLAIKKAEAKTETWDVFDDIDSNDSRWIKWINWVMKELYEYDHKLRQEMNPDYCAIGKMEGAQYGQKDWKLSLDYPCVFLKAQEGDKLACRFASIYRDLW